MALSNLTVVVKTLSQLHKRNTLDAATRFLSWKESVMPLSNLIVVVKKRSEDWKVNSQSVKNLTRVVLKSSKRWRKNEMIIMRNTMVKKTNVNSLMKKLKRKKPRLKK